MTLKPNADAFACSREGHKPCVEITATTIPLASVVATCSRCGRVVEVPADGIANKDRTT